MQRYEAIHLESGTEFGLLTVLERTDNQDAWCAYSCECSCGRQVSVKAVHLKNGKVQSCGCLKTMIALAHGISDCKDIVGNKYGKLTVIERDYMKMGMDKSTVSWWWCRCECGKVKSVRKTYLVSKVKNKACGCMQGIRQR